MTKTELTIALSKMFCNYVQESSDLGTFFEMALDYIEGSEMDFDFEDETQYNEAVRIVEDAIKGKY